MSFVSFHFILYLSLTLSCLMLITADNTCPYPCNPPPIAGTITPTTPFSQTGSYPPPTTPTYYLPPPSGTYPNYPPGGGGGGGGDYGGGGGGGGITMPPPPDPILPYFPYYYRNGVHGASSSSTDVPITSVHMFLSVVVAVSVLLYC